MIFYACIVFQERRRYFQDLCVDWESKYITVVLQMNLTIRVTDVLYSVLIH